MDNSQGLKDNEYNSWGLNTLHDSWDSKKMNITPRDLVIYMNLGDSKIMNIK